MSGPNPTLDTVVAAVVTADKLADLVLPMTPVAALQPLVDMLTVLLEKVQASVEGRGRTPAAEVAAADLVATEEEDRKFPVGKP